MTLIRTSVRIRGASALQSMACVLHQSAAGQAEGFVRVLGVDPGLTRCGVGVVDGSPGRPLTMVGVGVITTPSDLDIARRLVQLEIGLLGWVNEFSPDVVAVERVFSQHNVKTVMGTAQAAAVAMLVAARLGLPVVLHTPSEVKAALTGSGRADKGQVGAMVTKVLRLPAPPKPADAADALALAVCHVWRGGAAARIEAALQANRPRANQPSAGAVAGPVAGISGAQLDQRYANRGVAR